MKRLIIAVTLSEAERKCSELIKQGYHIDSVSIGRRSYLIVYSDRQRYEKYLKEKEVKEE